MRNIYILCFLIILTYFIVCGKDLNEHPKRYHKEWVARKLRNKQDRVNVKLGDNLQIQGSVNTTKTKKSTLFYQFQGIPYAKPPINDLRFEPPQEYKLEGFYSATYQRNVCTQNFDPFGFTIVGAEDCLYLNIYTPNITSKLPVLVYIYGGTFLNGDGNYETFAPDYLLDQNLVVVTFNYRVGVYGFMSTGDDVVPGNMGLKDQAMALKWVQKNIAYFGGDPKRVTIWGQSAGGVSVTYLVQSPKTKGLFHQAIAHSGNSLCPWGISRKAERNFRLLASSLLIFETNKTEIVRRMKNVSFSLLSKLSYASMYIILAEDLLNGLVYAPVIEAPNPTEIFSYKSYEQLYSGNFSAVPLIIGYNSEEARNDEVFGLLQIYFIRYDISPSGLVPVDMNVNDTEIKDKVGREIKETYYGTNGTLTNSNGTVKFIGQDFYVRPAIKYAELYSKWEKEIYLYRFSYTENSTQGVAHAEELPYFFRNKNLTNSQQLISERVVTLWSNFIKTGNPNIQKNVTTTWIPSSQSNGYSYLDIGEKFVVYNQTENPERINLEKWENWYRNYGKRPYDTY